MGEIQLKWNDHDKDLSTKLWEFFKDEYLVDFNVICHGQQKKVHKFVLAFLFPRLKESLRSTVNFSSNQDIVKEEIPNGSSAIPDAHILNLDNIAEHPEDMDYLIQFAYTGKTTVPNEHADCLMHIADAMEIKSLKESLRQWGEQTLSRLRRRPQLKKVIDEEAEKITSDDDESSSDGIECLEDCSDDTDDERNTRLKKKKAQERKGEHDRTKEETIQSNTAKTSGNQPKTDSEKKRKGRPPKEKKNLNCPHCNFVAIYPKRLEHHMERHAKKQAKGPKQYTCKICKKRFESRLQLDIHRDSNCGTEPPVCKYCDFKTHRKQILVHHVMSLHHMDEDGNPLEKNVKCPDCDYVCYAKHQLRVHVKSKHERLGKFKCKECNFTGPYIKDVLRHERLTHQNVRNYVCDKCGYRFKNMSHLKTHVLLKHKGVKPYKCDICNAEYSDIVSFKIHMQRHEGKVEYKFVCHICGHNLRRKYELKTHMRKKHGMELEDELATVDDPDPPRPEDTNKPNS